MRTKRKWTPNSVLLHFIYTHNDLCVNKWLPNLHWGQQISSSSVWLTCVCAMWIYQILGKRRWNWQVHLKREVFEDASALMLDSIWTNAAHFCERFARGYKECFTVRYKLMLLITVWDSTEDTTSALLFDFIWKNAAHYCGRLDRGRVLCC